jgi:hypothetical protein
VPGRPIPEEPTAADLPWLLDEGLRMVQERQASGLDIYVSIQRQLEYLKTTLDSGQRPTDEKIASLTLGVYAAREFETSDPEFANMLFAVNYLANRL